MLTIPRQKPIQFLAVFRPRTISYVDGRVSAEDLSDWLDSHAQEIHDTKNLGLRGLSDLAFSLLEDVNQGHRTDEEVRLVPPSMVPG